MKVLLGTLLVASLVFEATADAKSDCENQVKETAGKLISDCQAEWDEKCVRHDHNGDKHISTIEAEKSLFRLLARCQRPGNQKQRPGTQQKTNINEKCKKQVIAHIESLKGELSAKEAKDKYYELIKRCEPRQPGNQKQRPGNQNLLRLKNGLKVLLQCQQLDQKDRSLTDGPCAEAKKRKILSVKNLEDLTDEKIELYTNRMKETILKERQKAAKKAAANRKTEARRDKERRQIQGLKLSLTLERKLTECAEKSLDPCTIDGKEYSMEQVKAALPNIKTENQRRRVLIQRNRQRQRAAQRGNRRKPKSRE